MLFNPNGQTLLYGTYLLDISRFKQISLFPGTPGIEIKTAAYSPDGKLLAMNLRDSSTVTIVSSLWGIQNNHPTATLDAQATLIALAFSPNGQLLALRGNGSLNDKITTFVQLWDAR